MRKELNTTLKNSCLVNGWYDLRITNKMSIKFDVMVEHKEKANRLTGKLKVAIDNGSFRVLGQLKGDDGSYLNIEVMITEDTFEGTIHSLDDDSKVDICVNNIEDFVAAFAA